jgi:hypothetical protein
MKVDEIIAGIDEEIAKLQQARKLLSGKDAGPVRKNRGTAAPADSTAAPAKKRHPLSPEARARIVAAQKKRWAAAKKAAK